MNIPLLKACSDNNIEEVQLLLGDSSIDMAANVGNALRYACENTNIIMVSLILNSASFNNRFLAENNNAMQKDRSTSPHTQIINMMLNNKELFESSFMKKLAPHMEHNTLIHELLINH